MFIYNSLKVSKLQDSRSKHNEKAGHYKQRQKKSVDLKKMILYKQTLRALEPIKPENP